MLALTEFWVTLNKNHKLKLLKMKYFINYLLSKRKGLIQTVFIDSICSTFTNNHKHQLQ